MHWLNENFEFKHRVWHCREMEGEHTGQNICNYNQDMLRYLNITLDHGHVFLRQCKKNLSTNKTKSLPSCSRCGYKMEINISYARNTESVKSGVRYFVANYKNDQDSTIAAKG